MKLLISAVALMLAAGMLVSCTARPDEGAQTTEAGRPIAEGTITQISDGHGNAYTSIRPDRYEALGLTPGMRVRVAFGERSMVLPVGSSYTDVPAGSPVAVLHREGLTFAIRDGSFARTHNTPVGTAFTLWKAAGETPER